MAGSTYTPIQTTTSASDFSAVSFTSIPQTYTDLVIIMYARGTDANTGVNNAIMRFNSDGGNNYSYTRLYGDSASAVSSASSNNSKIDVNIPRGNETSNAANIIQIANYANATTYKTVLFRVYMSLTTSEIDVNVGMWRGSTGSATQAITQIDITGNFKADSRFTLYGIKAA